MMQDYLIWTETVEYRKKVTPDEKAEILALIEADAGGEFNARQALDEFLADEAIDDNFNGVTDRTEPFFIEERA